MSSHRSVFALLVVSAVARAHTTLLSDDFGSSQRKKIDAGSDLDAQLDAIVGSSGFNTEELNRIEDRLRQELRSLRPRAMPKLVLYVYPGQVTLGKLKDMQEVWVDVEITTEPCDRTFCDESMARLIEIAACPSVGGSVHSNFTSRGMPCFSSHASAHVSCCCASRTPNRNRPSTSGMSVSRRNGAA